jgi:hypothetical protein
LRYLPGKRGLRALRPGEAAAIMRPQAAAALRGMKKMNAPSLHVLTRVARAGARIG